MSSCHALNGFEYACTASTHRNRVSHSVNRLASSRECYSVALPRKLLLPPKPWREHPVRRCGAARDLHAVTAAPLAEDPTEADATPAGDDSAADHVSIEIDPEICLRFTARVFEDVTIGPSPLWLKQRLMAAGQRPISNVVDITNYVMLCTAQPLHAFDLDEVRGGRIVVRRAREGETMTTLDDVERRFSSEMALVCDGEGPSGIAGTMGGDSQPQILAQLLSQSASRSAVRRAGVGSSL
jgi:phenylalanyl-tRNA synthetase beta subunit